MPYGDKTGPNGQGPRNGRGFGNCNGNGKGRAGAGRGMGRGQNQNRGCEPGVAGQGNSWLQVQLNGLQTAVEKLTAQMGKDK